MSDYEWPHLYDVERLRADGERELGRLFDLVGGRVWSLPGRNYLPPRRRRYGDRFLRAAENLPTAPHFAVRNIGLSADVHC